MAGKIPTITEYSVSGNRIAIERFKRDLEGDLIFQTCRGEERATVQTIVPVKGSTLGVKVRVGFFEGEEKSQAHLARFIKEYPHIRSGAPTYSTEKGLTNYNPLMEKRTDGLGTRRVGKLHF